jgi:hypothetical protein
VERGEERLEDIEREEMSSRDRGGRGTGKGEKVIKRSGLIKWGEL